jgi:hypothetical protein
MAPETPQPKRPEKEPHVGIFFYVKGTLHIESTPVSQAERRRGDFVVHSGDHISFWESVLTRVTQEQNMKSYDHYPRGRVEYSLREGKFILYHDICIAQNKVAELIEIMNLPQLQTTKVELDSHYRCASCNVNYVSDSIWNGD